MGWRYSRRLKIFSWLKLNISSRGISTTIGVPGASINIGKNGTYLNSGIPGSGLSYRSKIGGSNKKSSTKKNYEKNTTHEVYEQVHYEDQVELKKYTSDTNIIIMKEIMRINSEESHQKRCIKIFEEKKDETSASLRKIQIPVIQKILKKSIIELENRIKELDSAIKQAVDVIDKGTIQRHKIIREKLEHMTETLPSANLANLLSMNKYIWEIKSFKNNQAEEMELYASSLVNRRDLNMIISKLDGFGLDGSYVTVKYIKDCSVLFSGKSLLLYQNDDNFALVEYSDVKVDFKKIPFFEEEYKPEDSKALHKVWKYSKADGTQDKRYKDNKLIDIYEYGLISIYIKNSVFAKLLFTNADAAEKIVEELFGSKNIEKAITKELDDCYKILEINSSATIEEVREAYKRLLKKCHPDKVADMDDEIKLVAERKTREIIEAYNAIINSMNES